MAIFEFVLAVLAGLGIFGGTLVGAIRFMAKTDSGWKFGCAFVLQGLVGVGVTIGLAFLAHILLGSDILFGV